MHTMTLEKGLATFLNTLSGKNRSAATIRAYQTDILQFIALTRGEVPQRGRDYQESVLSYAPAYVRDLQSGKGGLGVSTPAVAGTRQSQHHTNLCALRKTEREKGDAGDEFTMRQRFKTPYRYRLTSPPKALLKARLDNIAIIPASMLPLTKTLKERVNTFSQGAVFLCYAEENSRQRKILERVEETFREHGHGVRSLSMREVNNPTPHF